MNLSKIQSIIRPLLSVLCQFPSYRYTVMKWQPEDVLEGYSDLDLRVVVDSVDVAELLNIDSSFKRAYQQIINGSVVKARTFEHTPNIITKKEVLSGLGYRSEIATWSLLDGDINEYNSDKRIYTDQPFDASDVAYYNKILFSKEKYSLENELIYTHKITAEFKRYCVCWRFYATSIYAFSSLLLNIRVAGKSEGLHQIAKLFPKLDSTSLESIRSIINDDTINPEELMDGLKNNWNILAKKVKYQIVRSSDVEEDITTSLQSFARAVYLVRNKRSRLGLYLSPEYRKLKFSKVFIKNLVKREVEDMHMILTCIDNVVDYFQKIDNLDSAKLRQIVLDLKKLLNGLPHNPKKTFTKICNYCESVSQDLSKILLESVVFKKTNSASFNKRLTILVIKNDSLQRHLEDAILRDISKHFFILAKIKKKLTIPEARKLKSMEWKMNWRPYPSKQIQKLSMTYEANEVFAVLCLSKSQSENGIELGKRIKGNHYIAQKCKKSTIRGKYADYTQWKDVLIDDGVCYLCDPINKNPISLAPNVLHSVDNELEFKDHLNIFFPKYKMVICQLPKKSALKKLIGLAKLILTNNPPDLAHDFQHHQRVWQNILYIQKKEKIRKLDMVMLQLCAYWHDINKHHFNANPALLFYTMTGDKKTADVIEKTIDTHGWRNKAKTSLDKMLFDADKLEYVSLKRWRPLLRSNLDIEQARLFKVYFEGLNKRLPSLPSRLHYASVKICYEVEYQKLLKWARSKNLYTDNKFICDK